MPHEDRTFDVFVKWVLPACVLLAIVAGSFLSRPKSYQAPLASHAYGCFVDATGKRIVIDKSGFRWRNSQMKPAAFDLAETKSGLRLQFHKPLVIPQESNAVPNDPGSSIWSLAVQTKLDTPELVDGVWVTDAEGRSRLFERNSLGGCA
ncbi:hypothetical protein [Sphingobium sp. CR28]|uniref:hypothetical protein n=1 Tax=Sphingobium sp. CR28 TaxID=3400272 RepID=UPI003FF1317C